MMSMEDCDELPECAATDAAITAAEAGLRQGGGLHPAEEAFAALRRKHFGDARGAADRWRLVGIG